MVESVTLYRAPTTVADVDVIATWLEDVTEVPVTVRGRFLTNHTDDETAAAFANARVLSPYERDTGNDMLGIKRYERRVLEDPSRGGGVLYDGYAIQDAIRQRLPADCRSLDRPQIVFLDRAIGTWGEHDGRWHKRVSVLGHPALISIPGLYEAPAKPEQYYQAKQRRALLSGDPPPREVLEADIEGEFLIADDPRTTDALKGYALQAVHYLETGEAFCDEPGCRLYNAHRHPELIEAQLRDPPFCEQHTARY